MYKKFTMFFYSCLTLIVILNIYVLFFLDLDIDLWYSLVTYSASVVYALLSYSAYTQNEAIREKFFCACSWFVVATISLIRFLM